MAKKKNDESFGCLLIIIAVVVLSWIAKNIVGIIGLAIIFTSLYFRYYKKTMKSQVFWIIFITGVISTAYWFN